MAYTSQTKLMNCLILYLEKASKTTNFPSTTKNQAVAVKRNGEWISWTYEEYLAASRAAARGLLAVGLGRQRGVGIMGFNSPEMMFSFMASVFAGGLSCGIYPTSSGETVSYLGTETASDGRNFIL